MMQNDNKKASDIKSKILYVNPVEACRLMDSDMRGLSQEEAERRLEQYGKNELAQKKQDSMLKKLLANFTSLMAVLLWAGGIMAIISGSLQLGISIFCVNLINGLFSFFQEFKAEKATNALQQMLPANARVIRDGEERQILASEIVPGDIMILEEGDKISADARILRSSDFKADQSTLTGESNPIRKTGDALREECSYLEAENMVFSGTSAAAGTCRVLVVSTGMDSEFGKIAGLTQNTEKSLSPLQKELNVLTKQIAVIAAALCAPGGTVVCWCQSNKAPQFVNTKKKFIGAEKTLTFDLDYEPNTILGDIGNHPKVQKGHTEAEMREIFAPCFGKVKRLDLISKFWYMEATEPKVDPAALAAARAA